MLPLDRKVLLLGSFYLFGAVQSQSSVLQGYHVGVLSKVTYANSILCV